MSLTAHVERQPHDTIVFWFEDEGGSKTGFTRLNGERFDALLDGILDFICEDIPHLVQAAQVARSEVSRLRAEIAAYDDLNPSAA